MRKAAAGLILNNNRVLAFRRYTEQTLSIPCGLIEVGESPLEAAYREIMEETGLEVKLVEREPFIGFDLKEGCLVYTYLGEVVSGELINEAVNEGVPIWASKREIVYGAFGHYNNRALNFFNIQVPIAGKFHSHLTIEKPTSNLEMQRAAKLVNGKLTIINLSRDDNKQTDFMITHHYITGSRGLEDEHDVLSLLKLRARQIQEAGFKILRIKLEHEPLHQESNIDDILNSLSRIYTEIHIKCIIEFDLNENLINVSKEKNWHPSSNPFSKREDGRLIQFINKRIYGETNLFKVDLEVDKIVPVISSLCDIDEIKYETAIYDSNEDLDKWWIK